jgi:hypothetical protein
MQFPKSKMPDLTIGKELATTKNNNLQKITDMKTTPRSQQVGYSI